VHLEQKQSYSTIPAFSAMCCEVTVAEQHASLFPTQLALARWTNGGDIPHVHASERTTPMRAGWYADQQEQFQAWLDAGGFHLAELACLDCATNENDGLRRRLLP
jgi:hypothetical protein